MINYYVILKIVGDIPGSIDKTAYRITDRQYDAILKMLQDEEGGFSELIENATAWEYFTDNMNMHNAGDVRGEND